jgi:hypothetical protein
MLATNLRQAATGVLESSIRIAPPDTREWGQAMRGELAYIEGSWAAVMWALGGASVMVRHALLSFLIPGRRQSIPPGDELFARSVSLRKAALVAAGVCVLGALLFLAAPPFRQGIQVSLAVWRGIYRATPSRDPGGLSALARQAESRHDPEGLAFCAARIGNSRESARLAEEAVHFDPHLIWVYAIVAVRHPDAAEIGRWLPALQSWDPQNALFHLITAESVDIAYVPHASFMKPPGEENDPTWRAAMTAAFQSPKFDDYLDRLQELDRRVVTRYRFNDPYELLSGEEPDLPSYAFGDSQRFARSLLQSGQKLEAAGDRKGAAEKYWAVARFGQLVDSQGHTDAEHRMGSSLQAGAYNQLRKLSQEEGSANEAALFAYLGEKIEQSLCPGGT